MGDHLSAPVWLPAKLGIICPTTDRIKAENQYETQYCLFY